MNSSPMAPPVSKEFAASGYLFEQVRRAATAKGRADARVFVAEGQRLLERALRAGWLPRALLLGQSAACEPELATEAAGAFQALVDALAALQRDGLARGDDTVLMARFVWAVVHGVAMLGIDGQLPEPGGVEALAAYARERLATGIAAQTS